MSGFAADWLSLREPLDHAARSRKILLAVRDHFTNDSNLSITDIGSGTGSSIRALQPVFDQDLSWHLVDKDETLLDKAGRDKTTAKAVLADLSISLAPLFSHTSGLVTTSAFLDLVSEGWLNNLVREVTARNIPFYAALTYDGRARCYPELPGDRAVLDAFNKHQKTDKGFGPALGPDAAATALNRFRKAGYEIRSANSDWQAGSNNKEFQKMLLTGWRDAAAETDPSKSGVFNTWLAKRFELLESEKTAALTVGHQDFFAFPR